MIARIIFWQPIASPHQHDFLEAVAGRFAGPVILGVESGFPADRLAQGWRPPQHTRVGVVDISRPRGRIALAAHEGPDTLHVFSGFFSHPGVWDGFRRLARSRSRLAVMSEAPEQPLTTGWMKRWRGRWLARKWKSRLAFVLAIGGIGCEYFEDVGFPREQVVPFGYALASPEQPSSPPVRPAGDGVRFVSAGQLIRRKGIDLLVDACAHLPAHGWSLDIFGDGPERRRLARQAKRMGLDDRITFRGTSPSDRLRAGLVAYDRAILPSRFDGWGMLASESLAAGTPVICTDRCGAATIVAGGPEDQVVAAGKAGPLAVALNHAVAEGPLPVSGRDGVLRWFAAVGSAERAAARFTRLVAEL